MNAHNEQQARALLALGLDEFGHHTEAANVRKGIDLDDYKVDLWAIRAALDAQPAAAQEAVVWQWRCPRADTDWSDCDKSLYDELRKAIGGEAGEMNGLRYEVRALYAAPVTAAPGIDILHRALVSIAKGCCHAQKVADDALAEFRIDASPKGDEPRTPIDGCTESNCPRCRTHPDHRGDMEHAGIGRRPPQDSPKGGSEARDAVVVEGVIEFQRSDVSKPKACICCPDQPQHIYGRSVNWDGESWTDFNALETALRKHFLYKNENEGRRLRVTIEVVQAQAGDAEVQP